MTPCAWCGGPLPTSRATARYCSKACRQTAFRLRCRRQLEATGPNSGPGRFAYADPPYPGLSARYYGAEASYAGEVDHAALVASLTAAGYTGWALSTSSRALRDVLPLCPAGARVGSWVKPIGVSGSTYGMHSTWEPLIVVGGRRCRPGVRDWLRAQPARGGGDLMGRKPLAFCAWLFDCLGMLPGDELVDLFPGTGIVARAWSELSSRTPATSLSAGDERRRPVLLSLLQERLGPGGVSPGSSTSPEAPGDVVARGATP